MVDEITVFFSELVLASRFTADLQQDTQRYSHVESLPVNFPDEPTHCDMSQCVISITCVISNN